VSACKRGATWSLLFFSHLVISRQFKAF
jgi:hypothetical protein